ncbi:hypothetical protein LCER1_G009078 [Lachnellula cervina]|uniref:Uncharacterized protein n=1 Tax=Lachnellula cervina TaxID=1316786 RepID=A0A7D8UKV0_9HELO|nr:hypothetical protein LCER1_G009078 [Lachnellula cervina]
MFVYVLKYFFGLSESILSVYRADDSGPFPKPYAGSNISASDRIDHITHYGFLRALGGPGLLPTTRRFTRVLKRRLEEKNFSTEWTEMADLSHFFQDVVGASVIECVYGPAMLRINQSFMQDLWRFDASVPWLARGVPSFTKPSAHKPRQDCVHQLKRWYAYAREHFDESHIDRDGDRDPYWGSALMRYR